MSTDSQNQIWCYFCNMAHSTYREIRHIGEPTDTEARCRVSQQYLMAARKCRRNRNTLKSTVPFKNAAGTKTDDVIHCYQALTDLTVSDIVDIFRNQEWDSGYGGEKWAAIAEVLIQLKQAIDNQDLDAAWQVVQKVKGLFHNSGPLVPSPQKWRNNHWLQEKWPVLCE